MNPSLAFLTEFPYISRNYLSFSGIFLNNCFLDDLRENYFSKKSNTYEQSSVQNLVGVFSQSLSLTFTLAGHAPIGDPSDG